MEVIKLFQILILALLLAIIVNLPSSFAHAGGQNGGGGDELIQAFTARATVLIPKASQYGLNPQKIKYALDAPSTKIAVVDVLLAKDGKPLPNQDTLKAWTWPGRIQLKKSAWLPLLSGVNLDNYIFHELTRLVGDPTYFYADDKFQISNRLLPTTNAPVECFKKAARANIDNYLFNSDSAMALCPGTSNATAPIECFKKVARSVINGCAFNSDSAMALCGGTSNPTAPIECFKQIAQSVIGSYFFSCGGAITLCGGTSNAIAPLECFKETTRSNVDDYILNTEAAVKLCRQKSSP